MKVVDVTTSEVFNLDFEKLRRVPTKIGEIITVGDRSFGLVGFNSVFPVEGEPYLVIMVAPPKERK